MIKSMKTKIILVGLASLFVGACEPSVNSLMNDPKKRQDILKECFEMGLEARHEKKCKNAAEAEAKALKRDIHDAVKAITEE